MINIFDNYHFNSQLLHRSLKLAGYQHLTICLEDDGFLPDDVTSTSLKNKGLSLGLIGF